MMTTFSGNIPCPESFPRYIGVTGTNGKTSCAWWLAQLLQGLGKKTGLVGTLGCGVWESHQPLVLKDTGYTTPDARLLEKILADFKAQGVSYVVMEVSSHGLEQGRTRAVTFSTALFTNLSRDHLDYHGSMERYAAAKEKLFLQAGLRHAVINCDDRFGAEMVGRLRENSALQIITYSLVSTEADMYVEDLQRDAGGFCGTLHSPWGVSKFQVPVTGDFNLGNLLGVAGVLCVEGFSLPDVIQGLQGVQAPPGRLEPVRVEGVNVKVFVDFAHTPDALEKVLATLRRHNSGQLWCVFGCGGDRDKGKRPLMGAAASRLADRCVVTSDNPRSESPEQIIQEIISAMDTRQTVVKVNREEAIRYAIDTATDNDVVLIAGKGHEKFQDCSGTKHPFDDVLQAKRALQARLADKQMSGASP